jgi:hypothetical protein
LIDEEAPPKKGSFLTLEGDPGDSDEDNRVEETRGRLLEEGCRRTPKRNSLIQQA